MAYVTGISGSYWGTDADDFLTGDSGSNALYGRGGDDYIAGGAGGDVLVGGAGDDVIDGGAQNDIIRPGAGFDLVLALEGKDTIYFGDDAKDGSTTTVLTDVNEDESDSIVLEGTGWFVGIGNPSDNITQYQITWIGGNTNQIATIAPLEETTDLVFV
ncbi:MAG: hypothetical protein AAFU49_05820 [Pseudomonadota bacterium]